MSEEQLNAFLEKVKADTSLQEKFKKAASPEAAIEIAKAAGFSITSADIQSMQSATAELSDEELEGVAGGATGEPAEEALAAGMHRIAVRPVSSSGRQGRLSRPL